MLLIFTLGAFTSEVVWDSLAALSTDRSALEEGNRPFAATPGFGNPTKCHFSPGLLRMLNILQPHKGLGTVNPTLVLASLQL